MIANNDEAKRSKIWTVVDGDTKKVPLSEVAGKLKYVDPKCQMIKDAKTIGISFGE